MALWFACLAGVQHRQSPACLPMLHGSGARGGMPGRTPQAHGRAVALQHSHLRGTRIPDGHAVWAGPFKQPKQDRRNGRRRRACPAASAGGGSGAQFMDSLARSQFTRHRAQQILQPSRSSAGACLPPDNPPGAPAKNSAREELIAVAVCDRGTPGAAGCRQRRSSNGSARRQGRGGPAVPGVQPGLQASRWGRLAAREGGFAAAAAAAHCRLPSCLPPTGQLPGHG